MPKTKAQLETVECEDGTQSAPRAQNMVKTCGSAGAVWWLPECAMSKKGSNRPFEASGEDFTTLSLVVCCDLILTGIYGTQ